jgi:hypothetical protein
MDNRWHAFKHHRFLTVRLYIVLARIESGENDGREREREEGKGGKERLRERGRENRLQERKGKERSDRNHSGGEQRA